MRIKIYMMNDYMQYLYLDYSQEIVLFFYFLIIFVEKHDFGSIFYNKISSYFMRRSTRNSSAPAKDVKADVPVLTTKRSAPKDTNPPTKKKTNTGKHAVKSPSPSP